MLRIKVEVSAGSSIEGTFEDAISMAKRLGCNIDFDFNGIKCSCNSNSNPSKGIKNWYEAIDYNYKNNPMPHEKILFITC